MKRFSLLCLVALVVVASGFQSGVSVAGQADSLTLEDRILRVTPDQDWTFMGSEAQPWVDEYAQMIDGEPQEELWPSTQTYYEEHEVENVHVYFASLLPVSSNYDTIGTTIETRITTFGDDDHAAAYLANFFDSTVDEDETDDTVDWRMELIDPMPGFDRPILGWTLQEPFYDAEGELTGHASAVRYIAQIDNMLISALVMGPLVDFNFDLAFLLLEHQAACAAQDTPCAPVSIKEIATSWDFVMLRLFFVDEARVATGARWMFPVDEPIRAPEISMIPTSSDSKESTTSGTSDGKVTRTTRTGSSGDNTVTRTPRSGSSSESTEDTTDAPADAPASERTGTILLSLGSVRSEPLLESEYVDHVMSLDRVTITGEPEEADGERGFR